MREVCFPSLFFCQRINAIVFSMLLGVALFLFLPSYFAIGILLFSAGVLLFFAFRREEEGRKTLLCFLIGISFALLMMGLRGLEKDRLESLCHTPRIAEGYVVAEGEDGFDLALCLLDGEKFRKRVRISDPVDWSLGEKRQVTLVLHTPDPESARSEGVDLLARCSSSGRIVGESKLYSFVGNIRQSLSERFSSVRNGGFLSAVLLGERSGLTGEQVRAFRKTASSHILAISGLHVSQAVAFFVCLFQLFPVPRRVIRIFLYPTVILFYLLSGATVSVFRAAFMTLFAVTALLLRRRSDSVTALSFSAALLLFSNPYGLESFSFLLSYAATFGIVSCGAPLCEYLRFVFDKKKMHPVLRFFRSVLLSFAIASVSFLFTMPVQLLLFQTVTPFAPFYALLLLPLFHFCLVLVLLGAVLTWIPLLSAKIANSLLAIPAFFPDLVEWIAQGSPEPLTSRGVSLFLAIFFIAAIVILYWRKAPMTSIFLIYAIAFLFFGGFSLVQRILA